jgi:hypothetical protein
MANLEKINIREFRNNMSKYMEKTTPFAVTRHGQTIGYYIPARPTPSEADLLSLQKASETLDSLLNQQGITEDQLVQEFRQLREGQRSQ